MRYYVLTPEQYEQHKHETDQFVAWAFDGSKCIIECEDSCDITEYIELFTSPDECNDWRYNNDTDEWMNWISAEDYYGE